MNPNSNGALERGGPLFICALAILTAFAPMAIDMYLPALPAMGRAFLVSQEAVQWSLSAFFLGYGAGQLVWGPLGDRFGRRGPAAVGILLFVAGSIGCALAPSIETVIACRFVQAVGACAAPVLARVMVRDIFTGDKAASALSLMMVVMGVAPMVAPLIGGQLLFYFDWRAVFWALTAFGVFALTILLKLPETLPRDKRIPLRPSSMIKGYARLVANPTYMGYALCGGFILAGLFAYISGTPFVYIEIFGVSPQAYGLLFGLNAVALMIGSSINSRAVLKFGMDRILVSVCGVAAMVGAILLAAGATGYGGLLGIVVPLFFFMSTVGVIIANAMAGALGVFPQIAGSASALAGSFQFAAGAAAGWSVAALADGTPLPMTAVIFAASLCALASYLILVRGVR
ncbi:MAG TPA: Bcr/CflA family multidrug efflux MFS transporter [Alphaproteobacteria bacterium]